MTTQEPRAHAVRLVSKRCSNCVISHTSPERAVPLDSYSQQGLRRGPRIRVRFTMPTTAGVPLLRVKVQEKYETAVLRKDLEDVMGIVRKKKRA